MLRRFRFAFAALLFGLPACSAPSDPPPDPDALLPEPEGWADELALTPAHDANPDPKIVEVTLEAKVASVEFRPGVPSEMWTYNGTMPGPLLRANVGDKLIVHFTNHLPDETTIHWHGIRVPNNMDGTPVVQSPVKPGESFDYEFILHDAGTFWYHPHVRSNIQVQRGLYGALVVNDPSEPVMGHELVMVLDDVLLDDTGALMPPEAATSLESYFGREGNELLVNGRPSPTLRARPGVPQRWRFINAANARYFAMDLAGHEFVRVGGDGGLLEAPRASGQVMVAPGERADLVVKPEGGPGQELEVRWLPYDRGYGTGLRDPENLFSIKLEGLPATGGPTVPSQLRDIAPVDASGAQEQLIQLTEMPMGSEMMLGINGVAAKDAVPILAKTNQTQIWTIENTTKADHPFHLHGFFFQILSQDGIAPSYMEWKDTSNVRAQTTTKIVIPFDDRAGEWMFHCHILDHADLGMMATVMVEP